MCFGRRFFREDRFPTVPPLCPARSIPITNGSVFHQLSNRPPTTGCWRAAAFENDPAVIQGAAERRADQVRPHLGGPRAPLSQELLNQIDAVGPGRLLNTETKSDYDAKLRQKLRLPLRNRPRHRPPPHQRMTEKRSTSKGSKRWASIESSRRSAPAAWGRCSRPTPTHETIRGPQAVATRGRQIRLIGAALPSRGGSRRRLDTPTSSRPTTPASSRASTIW